MKIFVVFGLLILFVVGILLYEWMKRPKPKIHNLLRKVVNDSKNSHFR